MQVEERLTPVRASSPGAPLPRCAAPYPVADSEMIVTFEDSPTWYYDAPKDERDEANCANVGTGKIFYKVGGSSHMSHCRAASVGASLSTPHNKGG
jgi:hypothetical protein